MLGEEEAEDHEVGEREEEVGVSVVLVLLHEERRPGDSGDDSEDSGDGSDSGDNSNSGDGGDRDDGSDRGNIGDSDNIGDSSGNQK